MVFRKSQFNRVDQLSQFLIRRLVNVPRSRYQPFLKLLLCEFSSEIDC